MIQTHIAQVNKEKPKQQGKMINPPVVFSSSIARMKLDKMKQLMSEVDKRSMNQQNYGLPTNY